MGKILSISIAAYNAENDIRRCVDSLMDTPVAEQLDVIIVNDGSKDMTLQIAREYETRYPDIVRVIDKENGGHGSTINASLKVAVGKYYKILDSDDWVEQDGIVKLVSILREIEADLVLNPYHEIDAIDLKQKNTIYPYGEAITPGKIYSIDYADDIVIYMHSTTFKTSVIKRMGFQIDEMCFYVDMEYTLFPLRHVSNYVCFNFSVYDYLIGTATQSMNKNSLIDRRNQHLKVTKRIIKFYEDVKMNVPEGTRIIILKRTKLALLNQYKIYYSMMPSDSLPEIKAFDKWVKSHSKEVYKGPIGRLMMNVKFNRKTGFLVYPVVIKIMKIMHLGPNL